MDRHRTATRLALIGAATFLATLPAGCSNPFRAKHDDPMRDRPSDIVQAGATEPAGAAGVSGVGGAKPKSEGDKSDPLIQAEDYFRREEYAKAESLFEDIATDTKNRPEVAEKARYMQAESLRRQSYYPKAVDAYHKLLLDFPAGLYRTQSVGRMFEIADEWLEETREEMKPESERKKKSWTGSIIPVNFERKKPTIDTEGRALQALEQAYFNDPTGPYADKALFMLGRVKFHRGEYRDAARYFQQLAETHDRSPLRDKALEMAIIAKNNSSGGPAYDARDTQDAMKLINAAKATSPELARQKGDFLDEQAMMVRYQQAEKDFETAEFYRRTGHPGSAWFYYELVKRRYPGIKPFCDLAPQRMADLKKELDEAKDPSYRNSTKMIWKEYILGQEMPKANAIGDVPELKDPAPAATGPTGPKGAASVPNDIRPR
jgi:outer membrane protein assembly factor BamD (BamD/ComL family)